jgi:hypothetical protein
MSAGTEPGVGGREGWASWGVRRDGIGLEGDERSV